MSELISRQDAIDALWKALYEYEDKTEKQFIESDELDVEDWVQHRIFVQNMNDIDRQTILDLPCAQHWIPLEDVAPVVHGEWKDGRCTNCNVALREVFFEEPISYVDLKYCPFCGARMDGGR